MEEALSKLWEFIYAYAPTLVGAILTLFIGLWAIGWVTSFINGLLKKKKVDETIRPFLASLVNVGLKIMLLLAVASKFGVPVASFLAIFTALAFAIGMALQGSLGHFASGVLILIFKPYKVGHLVSIGGGHNGTVESIQIFNTVLKTLDNKRIIVPNGVVTSNVITNISGQEIVGVELTFGIGYGDDIDKARAIILEIGKSCPHILKQPVQAVVVAELGDSSVNLATRPFCKCENYWPTFFYMQEEVKKAFDREGINIPYPTMDLNLSK